MDIQPYPGLILLNINNALVNRPCCYDNYIFNLNAISAVERSVVIAVMLLR
jgi:hypothetical protein